MAKSIIQEVVFKNTTPQQLYELYMDAKKHALSTGVAADITGKEGANFSTQDGYITGKNLHLVKNKMIVQTWRANDWEKTDDDSIFIIYLEAKGKDTKLLMTHANVPDNQAKDLETGWFDYYWKPWKKYLKGN
ncbi:MAG: SRPBCC domain-containing protein [Chitinophagales bacterium]